MEALWLEEGDQLSSDEPVPDPDHDAAIRRAVLYVAIGFLLRNIRVWLHREVLSTPRRGGERIQMARLRLRTMLLWLQEVATTRYGSEGAVLIERQPPQLLTT